MRTCPELKPFILLLVLAVAVIGLRANATKCPTELEGDPRGRIIGYSHPDGDPIYENLGPIVSHTIGGAPIYEKTGATYGHETGKGNVTGYYGPDGNRLYDGEAQPRYSYDGDRITPQTEKKKINGYDP